MSNQCFHSQCNEFVQYSISSVLIYVFKRFFFRAILQLLLNFVKLYYNMYVFFLQSHKSACEVSMDDVSHEYDTGYGNLNHPSDVHGVLASMSQCSNVTVDTHDTSKSDEEENQCEEKHVGSWLERDETSGGVQEYIEEAVGMAWLQETENSESVSHDTACSEEEDRVTVKEEEVEENFVADKFSFDTKFCPTAYDSTAEEEIKYNIDEEHKYKIDDVNYDVDNKLIEQENCKDSDANDDWLGSESCLGNQIPQQKEKQLWDSSNDEGISPDDQWQSSSEETSSAESEEEHKKVRNTISSKPATVSSNFSEPVLTKPILSFDEYGNLTTTYHKPQEISTAEISLPEIGNFQVKKRSEKVSVQSPAPVSPKISHHPKETFSRSPCNGDIKTIKQKSKPVCESGENMMVSDQELKQAFKEEFMTAATSRYGRTRKRKVEDGFFFGTLNFNELRKITSSSPKKGKGSTSKHSSPDQKASNASKDDIRQVQGVENIGRLGHQNGFKEAESSIASGAVQMWDTKEADMQVQNETNKDFATGMDCNSTLDNIYHEAEAAAVQTGMTPLLNTLEKDALKVEATTESLDLVDKTHDKTSPASEKVRSKERRDDDNKLGSRRYRKHKRSNYTRRGLRSRSETQDFSASVRVRYDTITTSDRMLRGRSDVDKIKQALRDVEASHAVRRPTRTRRSVAPPVCEPSVSSDCQNLHVEEQSSLELPDEKSELTNDSKEIESEV